MKNGSIIDFGVDLAFPDSKRFIKFIYSFKIFNFLEEDILPRIRVVLRYKEDSLRSLFEAPTSTIDANESSSNVMLPGKMEMLEPSAEFSSDDESIEDMPLLKESKPVTAPSVQDVLLPKERNTVPVLSEAKSHSVEASTSVVSDKSVSVAPGKSTKSSWLSIFFQSLFVLALAVLFYFLYPFILERKDEFFEYILLL